MDVLLKLSAEQKGFLLQELLSFLLAKNGKAKKEDVLNYFHNKAQLSRTNLEVNDYLNLIKSLFLLCVKAEWTEQTTFWKVTEQGAKAYKRFKSPQSLFREMAVQAIIRHEDHVTKTSLNINRKLGFFVLVGIGTLCMFFYPSLDNSHVFVLRICAIVSVVLSIFLSESRTRLIIPGRLLFLEFLVLGATIVFGTMFRSTSLGNFFEIFSWGMVIFQIICILAVFIYPRFFASFYNYVNRNSLLFGSLVILMIILIGRGKGLIFFVWGGNINIIVFCLFFASAICFGIIYLLGGVVLNLSKVGYFDWRIKFVSRRTNQTSR